MSIEQKLMKRVAIIGSGGAGKSTLAGQLGAILNIPTTHLDSLYWSDGWVEMPKDTWTRTMHELTAQEQWILDGNYGATMDARLAAADTIIFLDLPRLTCVKRIIKRRLQYHNKTRPDMGAGCKERLDWTFIKWIWTYPAQRRPKILTKLQAFQDTKEIIILHSPREVTTFLTGLAASAAPR